MWQLLPLYADPNPEVREAFESKLAKAPSHVEQLINDLPRHVEDFDLLVSQSYVTNENLTEI